MSINFIYVWRALVSRRLDVFDFDGTLTRFSGSKTFQLLEFRTGTTGEDIFAKIDSGLFDNAMCEGAYGYLRVCISDENTDVMIISGNHSGYIKHMLTADRFDDALSEQEFLKIRLTCKYHDGSKYGDEWNKAEILKFYLDESDVYESINVYEDDSIYLEQYQNTFNLDDRFNFYLRQPGDFDWVKFRDNFQPSQIRRGTSALFAEEGSVESNDMSDIEEGGANDTRQRRCCGIL